MAIKILKKTKDLIKRSKLLFALVKPFSNIVRIFLDKRFLYHYFQGVITNPKTRSYLAKIESNFYKVENRFSNKTDLLRKDSYIESPLIISNEKVIQINSFLNTLRCHDQLDSSYKFDINSRPRDCHLAFYESSELFKSEQIIELAVENTLIEIYNDLYGCDPIIDHIAAWWSFPSNESHNTQHWHRDLDSLNLLKFLIYLTDVDAESGPHYLIPGSHNSKISTAKYKKHDDKEFEDIIKQNGTKVFLGPAGSNFLENTFAFHKGTNPIEKPRLLLEVIYSRVQTPYTDKKPFINLNDPAFSNLIKENIELFEGKIIH